jgi:hypothetical protein
MICLPMSDFTIDDTAQREVCTARAEAVEAMTAVESSGQT